MIIRFLWPAALFAPALFGAVSVSPFFTDHTVLQRDRPVPVWGTANPGESVAVSFHGETVRTKTDDRGHWLVKLQSRPAQTVGTDLIVKGSNTITLSDVVVGEVWLCSGQSNMGFVLSRDVHATAEIAASANPLLRVLTIRSGPSETPVATVRTSGWQVASPQTTANFSAVAYYFGKELTGKLGVPFGLIQSTVGGTPVEAWMNDAAFASDPEFAAVAERSRAEDRAMDTSRRVAWRKQKAKADAAGSDASAAFLKAHPQPAEHPPKSPMVLFNGKIAPLKPYAFRGALWYQGEANSTRPQEYHPLFAAMITAWRVYFDAGDFPFYWVQLPNFAAGDSAGLKWAAMREAQTRTLALPHTGQAVAIDVGEAGNLHPTNKASVGHRLAVLAEVQLYGLTGEISGPAFKSMNRKGAKLTVRFDHAEGLVARGGKVSAVQIAGVDRVFHPAQVEIVGGQLTASSSEVPDPVAIRYAWTNAPEANLYNAAGLPAAPFRSDEW